MASHSDEGKPSTAPPGSEGWAKHYCVAHTASGPSVHWFRWTTLQPSKDGQSPDSQKWLSQAELKYCHVNVEDTCSSFHFSMWPKSYDYLFLMFVIICLQSVCHSFFQEHLDYLIQLSNFINHITKFQLRIIMRRTRSKIKIEKNEITIWIC